MLRLCERTTDRLRITLLQQFTFAMAVGTLWLIHSRTTCGILSARARWKALTYPLRGLYSGTLIRAADLLLSSATAALFCPTLSS